MMHICAADLRGRGILGNTPAPGNNSLTTGTGES